MRYLPKYSSLRYALPLMTLDAMSVVVSFWLALAFRFDGRIPAVDLRLLVFAMPIVVAVFVAINFFCRLYQYVWQYTSANEILMIGAAAMSATLLLLVASLLWVGARPIPISVIGLGGVFSSGMFTTARYRQRLLTGLMGYLQRVVGSPDRRRVLIVGAGEAGQVLARQLKARSRNGRYELVGFVDDNPKKIGLRIYGTQVLGDRQAIPDLVAERGVSLIIIAIHRISGPMLRDILSICLTTQTRVKILPDFFGQIEQPNGALPLRDITAGDLLGRQLCEVDQVAYQHIIAGKVVLITGASGSIGAELCRQVLPFKPHRLLMLDNNETGLHDLLISLQCPEDAAVATIVADVTNQPRLETIFAMYRPEIVFHVAAYKHVPMMERHPDEAVRVNIHGTASVADLAGRYAVERFVFISTDKAVNPCSIMGATKRVGELLMMSNAARFAGNMRPSLFTAVRFGNVLGSRGSVAPTFARQIDQGGPVTITHPEMTRYFISLSEAVSLIIQAAALTEGGDIFMLDMGQAIRIEDLAHKMIRLRGLRPGEDIPIVYSGMRPGEKLHEELVASDEEKLPTDHPRILRIRSSYAVDSAYLLDRIAGLIELAFGQRNDELVEELWRLVQQDALLPHDQARALGSIQVKWRTPALPLAPTIEHHATKTML